MPPHPPDRDLRTFRDGEISALRSLVMRFHLARCVRCRERLALLDAESRFLTELLGSREPAPDVADAWLRFQVRSGSANGRRHAPLTMVAVVAGLLVVTLGFYWPAQRSKPAWTSEVDWLLHPTPVAEKVATRGDDRFVERLLRLEAAGEVRILEDACCQDRDGEGPADDGLAIVQVVGRRETLAVLYEDLDRSHALTQGDLIRLVSRTGIQVASREF